ncbi:MAG TPA: T9SS type A sorting domain-containing protein [Bacteroidia bacterium]|nr:T9SS type A sorting domain-containing protein [Bacteroidia bacterium]
MKTKITLSIIAVLFSISASAQWVACNNGMDNYVWGSAVYNGNLYACGNFEHADGNQALAIAKWNGSAWSDVGGGFQHGAFSYAVRGLIVYNNELYAGGYVDSVAGMPIHKVAKWNGTNWSAAGMDCPISTVNCFAVHNGELYAGGQGSGLVKVCVAKWTGTNWIGLDTEAGNTDVYALASYNGDLYAGGAFTNFNGTGAAGVAKWNGSAWSDIGSGFTAFNVARAFAVFNNKLYIGGGFTTAGGIAANNIVSWDGASWTALSGGVNSGVQSLLSNGNKLFVGGMFWMVNGVTANRAAYWNGSSWTVLGTDLGSGAKTISIYNNELYYGGEGAFNGHNYIAKWSGGTFTGIKESEEKIQFSVFPNPVSEKLFISSTAETKHLCVSDILGKRMNVTVFMSKEISGVMEINVSGLTPGIYFLSTESNSSDAVKFVVQR